MKNKEINYRLLNITLFVFIIYLLNKLNVLNKIIDFILLILLSLILSYIIYPLYKKINNKLNKYISIIIIYGMLILFLLFIVYSVIPSPNFILKITDLIDNILKFINKINIKYDLNINIDLYLNNISNYIINNSVFVIRNIFDFITKLIFVFVLSICILFNMKTIKNKLSKSKYIILINNINNKLKDYILANIKIILIQIIEYTIVFSIIGHPNYLLLGLLNSINSFIPIFGSIITNVVAITTASVISTKLLLLTAIVSLVLPNVDAYLINPKIYRNTNKISQTLSIATVIIGGLLFGFYGMIFALPLLIIIFEIIKYTNTKKI